MKKILFNVSVVLCFLIAFVTFAQAENGCQEDKSGHINIWNCQSSGGTTVAAGGSHWIRWPTGFSGSSEEEVLAALPGISHVVTMNGVELPMDGELVMEYAPWGAWEIVSYHCTGMLTPGIYNLTGTSYGKEGEVMGSAECVLEALDAKYTIQWWFLQPNRTYTTPVILNSDMSYNGDTDKGSCLMFDDDLNLTIPCVEFGDSEYGFKLVRKGAAGFLWELDLATVEIKTGE